MSRWKHWLALGVLSSAIAAMAVWVGAWRAPSPVVRVVPERKGLAIATARVEHNARGSFVRLVVESPGADFNVASVRKMTLYRATLEGVNPMTDHVRGLLAPPLGWDPKEIPEIATFDGPAAVRQSLTDAAVLPGETYVYRVAYSTLLRTERSPLVAVRVHAPETWWPTDRVAAEIAAVADSHPGEIRVDTIGRGAHQGLPIVAVRAGSGAPSAPTLVLVGAIHAGESGPELIIPALGRLLDRARSDPPLAAALQRLALLAVPVLNVDERDRLLSGNPTYLRVSPQGIDLNRNFPSGWEEVSARYRTSNTEPDSWTYRGPAPLAAVEARAIFDALSNVNIAALLSYHWLYSLSGPQLEQPTAMSKATEIQRERQTALSAAWFSGLREHPYSVDVHTTVVDASPGGSLVTWTVLQRGAPAFEVEGSSDGDPRLGALFKGPPSLPLLEEYRERHTAALASVLLWLARTVP